ncbi:PDDEXK nuclease domain-containing protein [Flavitalea sp. BT771]|uniref:PDDEXK nuclease domain-containing protein n=1 Tax=Flavitalea sp. BT771 TaxID=3063329 RepID=UPI0026E240AA|nr:PDDEXK nuclease domain-containing protein [Flavitalea sp. BT771]MDO6432756.1 PDDEXK nuclease domain-containing protein [Flavitalea sp. BT771]MDV6221968.1 PDDEXK nuclease domain-containing protein [Flavitalea sp. BT771]
MLQELSINKQYTKWLVDIKQKIQVAQIKAAVKVNHELLNLYWELGEEICEKQKNTNWGEALIDQLSKDLSKAFPGVKGFSRTNLFFMRKWFLFYQNAEKVSQLVRQIPWGHNREIVMKCTDIEEAIFYVQGTIQNNWSRAILLIQIEGNLYKRQGKAIHNFQETLPDPQADLAREALKNPYNFDFLTMGKQAHERDIEIALTDHIQKFLLELGHGFAYMGKQYHINVAGDDFFLDMLFYHTRLRCYVVVELKATEFQPEFAGKLNFYLNIVNAQLKHPNDQPSIGILLCKTPKKVIVEYALENISSPLGVAEYQIMNSIPDNLKGDLPSIEELEEELVKPSN